MVREPDTIESLLFSEESDKRLVNFKLFRGASETVESDDLRAEIVGALTQVRDGSTLSACTFVERASFKPVPVASL